MSLLSKYGVHLAIAGVGIVVIILLLKRYGKIFNPLWNYLKVKCQALFKRFHFNNVYYRSYKEFVAQAPTSVEPRQYNKQLYLLINLCSDEMLQQETGLGEIITGHKESYLNDNYRLNISSGFFVQELRNIDAFDAVQLKQFWLLLSKRYRRQPIVILHAKPTQLSQKAATVSALMCSFFSNTVFALSLDTSEVEDFESYMTYAHNILYHPSCALDVSKNTYRSVHKHFKYALTNLVNDNMIELYQSIKGNTTALQAIENYISKSVVFAEDMERFYRYFVEGSQDIELVKSIIYLPSFRSTANQHLFNFKIKPIKEIKSTNYKMLFSLIGGGVLTVGSVSLVISAINFSQNVNQFESVLEQGGATQPEDVSNMYNAYIKKNPVSASGILPKRFKNNYVESAYAEHYLSILSNKDYTKLSQVDAVLLSYLVLSDNKKAKGIIARNSYLWEKITGLDHDAILAITSTNSVFSGEEREKFISGIRDSIQKNSQNLYIDHAYFDYLLYSKSVSINDWQKYIDTQFIPLLKSDVVIALLKTDHTAIEPLGGSVDISKLNNPHAGAFKYFSTLQSIFNSSTMHTLFSSETNVSLDSVVEGLKSIKSLAQNYIEKGTPLDKEVGLSIVRAKINTLTSEVINANSLVVVSGEGGLKDISFQGNNVPLIYTQLGIQSYVSKIITAFNTLSRSLSRYADMSSLDAWKDNIIAQYVASYKQTYTQLLTNTIASDNMEKMAGQSVNALKVYLSQVASKERWNLIRAFYQENTENIASKTFPEAKQIEKYFKDLNAYLANENSFANYLAVFHEISQDLSHDEYAIYEITSKLLHQDKGSYLQVLDGYLKQSKVTGKIQQSLSAPLMVVKSLGVMEMKENINIMWHDLHAEDFSILNSYYPVNINADQSLTPAVLNDYIFNANSRYKQFLNYIQGLYQVQNGQYSCKPLPQVGCLLTPDQLSELTKLQALVQKLQSKGVNKAIDVKVKLGNHASELPSGEGVKFSFVQLNDFNIYGINADVGWIDHQVKWWKPVVFTAGFILTNGQVVKVQKNYPDLFAFLLAYHQQEKQGLWKLDIPKTQQSVAFEVSLPGIAL